MYIEEGDREEITHHLCVCLEKLIFDHDRRHAFLGELWNVAEAMISEWKHNAYHPPEEAEMEIMYFGTPQWTKLVSPLSDKYGLRPIQIMEMLIRAISYWSALKGGRQAEADMLTTAMMN